MRKLVRFEVYSLSKDKAHYVFMTDEQIEAVKNTYGYRHMSICNLSHKELSLILSYVVDVWNPEHKFHGIMDTVPNNLGEILDGNTYWDEEFCCETLIDEAEDMWNKT